MRCLLTGARTLPLPPGLLSQDKDVVLGSSCSTLHLNCVTFGALAAWAAAAVQSKVGCVTSWECQVAWSSMGRHRGPGACMGLAWAAQCTGSRGKMKSEE